MFYVAQFYDIINFKGYQNRIITPIVKAILPDRVELHWEGSAVKGPTTPSIVNNFYSLIPPDTINRVEGGRWVALSKLGLALLTTLIFRN